MIVADKVANLINQVIDLCVIALRRAIPRCRTQGGPPLTVDKIYVITFKPHFKEKVLGLGMAVDASLNKDLESKRLIHSGGNLFGDFQVSIQGRTGNYQVALELSTFWRIVRDSLGEILALD